MQSIRGTLLLLVLGSVLSCLSGSGIRASPSLVADLLNGVAKGAKDIGEIAVNIKQEGTQALEEFVENLKNANSDLLKDAGEIGKAVRKNLQETLASFQDNVETALEDFETHLKKERNSAKKAILENAIDALNKMNETVGTVQTELSEINLQINERINKQIDEAILVLQDWEQTQLDRVKSISEGQKIIAELAERFKFILNGCKLEVDFQRLEFEYQLQAQLEKYETITKQLMTAAACTVTVRRDLLCRHTIQQLIDQLVDAPDDLYDLLESSTIQMKAIETFDTCSNIVLTELQKDLKEAETSLDKLLAEQNAQPDD